MIAQKNPEEASEAVVVEGASGEPLETTKKKAEAAREDAEEAGEAQVTMETRAMTAREDVEGAGEDLILLAGVVVEEEAGEGAQSRDCLASAGDVVAATGVVGEAEVEVLVQTKEVAMITITTMVLALLATDMALMTTVIERLFGSPR